MRGKGVIWFAGVILFAVLFLPSDHRAGARAQDEERRVALVIGNFSYSHVPRLANPGNDASLIATTLTQLGFHLIGGAAQENVDKAKFDHLVQDFGRDIQGADVALFYYAGHGMQVDGTNWLVPTDANPTRPQDLEFQMVSAELVLKQMDGAGTRLNLVILDACRNNPFATLGTRSAQGGLAQMRAPEGTMISFATQPGNVAADGSGANGPYAAALATAMREPGLDIFRLFNTVGLTVKRETSGTQLPWVSSSPIDGEFYFTETEATAYANAASTIDIAPGLTSAKLASAGGMPGSVARTSTSKPGEVGAAAPEPVASASGVPGGNSAPGDAAGVRSLQALASRGDANAQTDLGVAYAKGLGVPRDDAAARRWFETAAARGSAKAQYWFGAMLERGRGGPRSYAEALEYYHQSGAQAYPPAEFALGRIYGRGLGVPRDLAMRTEWIRRAAEHGFPIAEWALGNLYQFGNGVDKDMKQALQWYGRAAADGVVRAETRLGAIYEHGNGVAQDYTEAIRWFRQAADAGNPAALNDLGVLYRRGLGVKQDYAQAMQLFRQAADKGDALAMFNIGLLYANGHGVTTDEAQARVWFDKAAALHSQPAIDKLVHMESGARASDGPQAATP